MFLCMHSSPKNLKTKIIPKRFRAWFLASFLLASTVLSGFFVFQSASAATGINQQISFQGKVVNSNGTNVTNGSYTFVFRLYDVDTAGTHIWTETKSLTVTDGIFQTNLGDTTALPGSVDFNTDNIYLGINFNSDGEMSPRVRFTAAPYAFNAKKVGGLTVTDTTGTLTIPNSETISFGGSFTTSATNDVTLTTTGATNVTLPTTGTLVTLAGTETLTNKTIGSTGLVFSGATTDLTTGTNEDLNLTANGSGDIVIAVDSGTFVNLTGGTDGTGALTVAAGDVTLSDGDLIVSGGDANFTLDVADTFNVIKSSANAGDVMNITASSVNAIDGLQLDLTATTDSGADNVSGIDIAWTESADADVWTAVNLPNTTTTNSNTRAFVVGTGYDTILDSANLDISGAGVITGATGITSSGTITFSSISGSTQCLHVNSSGVVSGTGSDCGAGGGSLDASYTSGNTITTDSGNNVIITLQEVVAPTSFVIENQDTAGVSAERIFNSIASGTLTNGLLLEQTGAGTMTNAIQIAETAGTITDGILITGTLGNILNSPTLDITGAGAITGATGITSSGTITFSGLSTAGIVTNTSGGVLGTTISVPIANGGTNATSIGSAGSIAYSTGTAYAFSAVGTAGQALVSGGTGVPTFFAPTAGSVVFAGTSGILQQDNASFFFDDTNNRLGLGTTSPAAQLSILGTSNALRLSYDVSNYASLSTASDGTLSLTSSNTSESQFVIGTGASVDDSVGFDGASVDYYAGLDHTTGYFTIGTGFTVGSSTLFAIDSTGNIGIGTGVTAPAARLDLSLSSTNTTADTLYAQRNVLSDTGIVTTGTDTTYGVNTSVTRTGATGGTLNTYGNYISVTADNAGSGTSTAYGLYASVSGADTNYAGIFTGGNVGIGDTTPDNPFEILSTSQQLRLSYTDGSVDGAIYVDSSEYLTLVAGTTSEVNRVQIGAGGAGNSTPDLFGLDVKSDTGDPAGGFEGAMYYNTLDNVFRCYQNTGWTNCIGSGGSLSIGSSVTSGTTGSILFVGAGPVLSQDNASFFFDDTNNRLGLGDVTPEGVLDIEFTSTSTSGASEYGSNISISDTGVVTTGTDTTYGQSITVIRSGATGGTISAYGISAVANSSQTTATDITVGGYFEADEGDTMTGVYASTYNGSSATTIYGVRAELYTDGAVGAVYGYYLGPNIGGGTPTTGYGIYLSDVQGTTDYGVYQAGTDDVNYFAGSVGIGINAPTSLFELYGGGAADVIATLTAPDATYDPAMKFRTGASPSVQFTLGVDNSDSDKFKIYSGDGLGSGDEFVIDANGVTTIANLNLGATNFDTDAGIISWVDMAVTASSPDNTVESYTALLDGQSMLSLYALSDGAGSIDTRRVQLGDGGAGVAQPVLLGLDVRSSTGDPTDGFEGAMYYNTVDNVFRCYQNTGWTNCIGAGGSTDLQTAYGNDADGSNVTISLTAADDGLIFTNPTSGGNNLSTFLLQLDQANTTANMLTLDIVQASNASNAVNITANAIDGETGLAITTNGLTSGSGMSVASSSTAMTGNLAQVTMSGSNAANTGDLLELSNTGTSNTNTTFHIDHRATGTGNLAMRVDDESSDTTPFIIDGNGSVGIGTSSIATPTGKSTPALQVGSVTNRVNSSFYGDVTAEGYDIKRDLTGIIDIFVYDTSRDADGGEWRNSTLSQQLSWFTETKDNTGAACVIGTDDRCGKSEFPRKAILVTTATALYIFDGGDNTLWMTFTQAGTYAMGADTNNNPSGVGAQNGVIVVGTNGSSATGMYAFDFKQDTLFRYNATNRVQGDKNIGNRNSTVTYSTDANTSMAIADAVVNDVSIAMQTSSTEGMLNTLTLPIDSAASPNRGVTIIAAATNTAISVVNMGSRKTLNYSDVTNDDYYQVVMTTRGRLYATNATQQQLEEWRNVDRDVANETNGTPDRTYDELTPNGAAGKTPITTGTAPTFSASNPGQLAVIERSSSARESAATTLLESGDIVFVGSNQGLAEVHTSGGNLAGASWSKITTTTVATPYMVGAPRGVFTFDEAVGSTAATSAVGTAGSTKQVLDQAGATAPTFGVNGVRGKAINFNNNSYLCSDANSDGTCDADTDFNAGTIGFTVSLWFKHSTTAASDTLFERCYTPATPTVAVGCIWAGMTSTGAIKIGLDSITTWTYETTYDDSVTSTATYADNQWHHMVYTNTDTDICLYIDGKQAAACDTSLAATATLDASQVLTVGGACSGANCGTGTNFWDGSIDDFVWSSNGATTDNGIPSQGALKLYLDGRAHLIRPTATVTDATTFSSTTIGDSGESYTPGSFAGLVVEITGGTGSGQSRMIVSNDTTTFTVSPAWSTTPDTTTDYQVSPSKLYGATNNVTAIAPDLPTSLNRLRKVYVGTSDGSDGGGVTVFTNAGTGSLKTQVIHSDAGYPSDDLGSAWSGTDADDISAMQAYSDTVAIGNGAFMRAQRADIGLKQLQLDVGSAIEDIRQELVSKQLFGSTQDVLGLGQGADLAERYYSNESLEAGEIVSIDKTQEAGVRRSVSSYQRDVIGVVATSPGIVLGPVERTPYPIALVGRVPVRVTNENGPIYAGDRITASSRPGFGMFANQAGRVVGTALADAGDWVVCDSGDISTEHPLMCTTVLVFVNLTDYTGQLVELAMAEREATQGAGLTGSATLDGEDQGMATAGGSVRLATSMPTRQEQILSFLKELRDKQIAENGPSSEVFTGRVSASTEVITPTLYADQIFAKNIKADSIEGLSIWTNQIASLEEKYAGLVAVTPSETPADTTGTPAQTLLNLEKLSVGSMAVSLDATILGKLSLTGGMTVGGTAQFEGETVFARLANFLGKTIFKGQVSFESSPLFGQDTAGFAVIEEGAQKVRVTFETPYEKQPIVAVTLTNDASPLSEGADEVLKQDIEILEHEYVESVFDEDVRYIVTEKSPRGFTIILSQSATRDLQFSWVALSVDKAKSFNSEKVKVPRVDPVTTPGPVTVPPTIPEEEVPTIDSTGGIEPPSQGTDATEKVVVPLN